LPENDLPENDLPEISMKLFETLPVFLDGLGF